MLAGIRRLLKPGGRLLVITDNTGSPDFRLFKRRHWGGYHFPRHCNLFDQVSCDGWLRAHRAGEVDELATMISPVNWVYSMRNTLDDWGAPRGSSSSSASSRRRRWPLFTAFDALCRPPGGERCCGPCCRTTERTGMSLR